MVAIVTDGTRILGLGDIGPKAGLPVMEGKSILFKYLGGVDAVPICLGTKDPDEIISAVKWLQPSFGAVNLEDIAQPKCFRILDTLKATAEIPVWHDDQQGTATVILSRIDQCTGGCGEETERRHSIIDWCGRCECRLCKADVFLRHKTIEHYCRGLQRYFESRAKRHRNAKIRIC